MIVVDSSVWYSILDRRQNQATITFDAIPDKTRILVADIVLLEVLQGARDELHAARLERDLRIFPMARLLDETIAVQAALNYRTLRGLGWTIRSSADLIIATYCIAKRHHLLHDDRDFAPFEQHLGLRCL